MESLLPLLFETVTVPKAVWDELLIFHSRLPGFVLLRLIADAHRRLPQTASLGHGEAEAITLARELNADLLLTDDLKARIVAANLNLKSVGLLGLLIHAKHRRHVTSVRDAMLALETRGGLSLSDSVKAEALKLAREIM